MGVEVLKSFDILAEELIENPVRQRREGHRHPWEEANKVRPIPLRPIEISGVDFS